MLENGLLKRIGAGRALGALTEADDPEDAETKTRCGMRTDRNEVTRLRIGRIRVGDRYTSGPAG